MTDSTAGTGPRWSSAPLGDVTNLHRDQITPSSFPKSTFAHHSIPAFDDGAQPVIEFGSSIKSNKFTVPPGAVLVSRLNPRFPRVWTVDAHSRADAICSTEFLVLRPRGIDVRFLQYCCLAPAFRAALNARVTGTSGSHQRVTPLSALEIRIPVPPRAQQRAIAHVLGTLDDRIELNRRMSETLEAVARALFKSWFVDFDPVRAKMQGRDTGLPPHIADLFPDHLVDSAIGRIPEGWAVAPLEELIAVNPRRRLERGREAPYLPMSYMPTRSHAPGTLGMRRFGSGARFLNGDTLVARITPCLENGKTAYVDFLHDDEVGWGSTEYIVLRPRQCLPDQFAYYLGRSRRFRKFAIQSMTGTSGRQRVSVAAVKGFTMIFPPPRVSARFGRIAASFLERVRGASRDSEALLVLRDTLLPKLISGSIEVKTAAPTMRGIT